MSTISLTKYTHPIVRFIPESARWLLSRNRVDEAEAVIQNAARVNKVSLPKKVFENFKEEEGSTETMISVFRAPTLLIRSLIILLNWYEYWLNSIENKCMYSYSYIFTLLFTFILLTVRGGRKFCGNESGSHGRITQYILKS